MTQDPGFTEEQKQYLEGFIAALFKKRGEEMPTTLSALKADAQSWGSESSQQGSKAPGYIHREAQDRWIRDGGKLVPEELAKRAKDPFDMWDEMLANAAAGRFPTGTDIFLHKFHGLFYVAPNQDAFMLRLRLPGGILGSHQAKGLCDVAERYGAGYLHISTRANLQIREIGAAHPIEVLTAIQELGLTSRGAGADNIRNLTGSPAAGIDPQELIDTRPLTRELYHYILNHRELYGLPRKFNIAFDGGGRLGVLADTNDIGFAAVAVGPGKTVPPGVYFRMLLGGITGHGVFARDSGVLLLPHEVVPAAVAMVRLFIDYGDRTDRKRARLHYLIERWGTDKCLAEAAVHLSFAWRIVSSDVCEPRGPVDKHGHVGIHPQSQPGLFYIGVVLPVGRLEARQLRGLAEIAKHFGSGALRLTVWQNLLISDIPEARLGEVGAAIEALDLRVTASAIRGGIVACTGNMGCKFALSDTKQHGLALVEHLDARLSLDTPLNIHLTGCPNSCAQHYVGDIGLLATKVDQGGDEEVEGYHITVGGGSGAALKLGREIYHSVPAEELPGRVEAMLRGYLAACSPRETFHGFANRHSVEELTAVFDAAARVEG
ncbi:MAG: NirA family protein [Alphaproteobacteria bacterium]|nr:NirA family protein [Alphaproteobacteria bacterium]